MASRQPFDLLSLDIDGNDYWVWMALEYRPRVIVIEYNAHVTAGESKTIVYDPEFRWRGTDYFGASLRALKELGDNKGYTPIHVQFPDDTNRSCPWNQVDCKGLPLVVLASEKIENWGIARMPHS